MTLIPFLQLLGFPSAKLVDAQHHFVALVSISWPGYVPRIVRVEQSYMSNHLIKMF